MRVSRRNIAELDILYKNISKNLRVKTFPSKFTLIKKNLD